ncbi:hypothetical protein BaRGS_00026382 [Batillaria attramentaria]|uniref:Uncharacterized protein n=1 Tax=Batillaria attramentaria TaxID=370345 RepID=A0ABD0K679_9CAEN
MIQEKTKIIDSAIDHAVEPLSPEGRQWYEDKFKAATDKENEENRQYIQQVQAQAEKCRCSPDRRQHHHKKPRH